MATKKAQCWFDHDSSYELLTYNLQMNQKIRIRRTKKGNLVSPQGFTFEIEEIGFEGVTFQLTRKNKLGIYYPISMNLDEIVLRLNPVLAGAAGIPVKLTTTYGSPTKKIQSVTEEAEKSVILECINKIQKTTNETVLYSRLIPVRKLAINKRIVHQPEVLQCLDSCLENPLVTENIETFRLVIEILRYIIYFEEKQKSPNLEAIRKIKNDIALKLISILEKQTANHYLLYSLPFLGLSGRKEAADLILEKIKSNPSKSLEAVVDSFLYEYANALIHLYPKHRSLIDNFLDKLIESGGEAAAAGLALRKRIVNGID
ncbi:hypothetical protein JW988_02275 [Candidatus Bathyarchaeota archaeon]|nr:hypothetical protein [Candidatus Bathyarchaeota archaeon]